MLDNHASDIQTPCYFYSVSKVESNVNAMKAALGTQVILSVKANNNTDLLIRTAHFFDDGVEVATIKEFQTVVGGDRVRYINNPSADKKFLRAAISGKARLIIDNISQLELVVDMAQGKKLEGIILRVNPVVLSQFNPLHPKVRPDQFGMDWDTLCSAVDLCKSNDLPLLGFHLFKGSYSFEKTALATVDAVSAMIEAIESRYEQPLSFVNLGGGFSEHWQQSTFDFSAYRQKLAGLPNHITLAHESGRGLMANIGYFATRVRYTKQIEQNHYVICDGGIAQNFLLAKTENALRKLNTPTLWQKPSGEAAATSRVTAACQFVGSSCSKDDVIGKQSDEHILPQPGDICIFDNCGAYNASYTVAPFLQLPSAQSYIIE